MEDFSSIKLKLPDQDQTEPSVFRPDAESARQWVQGLPNNSSAVVQMMDEALNDLNRTVLAPEVRYDIMEVLVPNLESALSSLAGRFLKRPLVMPTEPRQLAHNCLLLMSAATTAYAIVAIQAIQQPDSIRDANPARLTCEAIQRALLFAGRQVLQTYQLHQSMERHLWETLHQIYALAEYQRLTDLPVSEPLWGASTVQGTYAQALVLSCCKPNQLRQGDLAALHRGFQQWGDMVRIESREQGDELFLVDLNRDQPAQYRALFREHPTTGCRAIDTDGLLSYLKSLKEEINNQGASFDRKTSVSLTLLDHLVTCLDSVSLRNFKRTASNSPMWVCVGLSNTHFQVSQQQLRKQVETGDAYVPAPSRNPEINLFSAPPSTSKTRDKSNPGMHLRDDPTVKMDLGVEIDSATRARLIPEGNTHMPSHTRHPVFEVQLANTSANGYCLEWVDEIPADLRSGDIIGLKEDKEQNEWAIGVIRWLSRLNDTRTLVGLELLSPRAIAFSCNLHLPEGGEGSPVRVLLLPEIKIVGQPSTLITPRAGFKERQKVTLRNGTHTLKVKLQHQVSSTGGFDQFEVEFIKELGDVLAKNKAKTEFDSLWNNI